ncbi:MAG: hypothetical protein B7Z80_04580 [Rhodospirillales bacterium 20-64-7]|nr:MAG: hypothetical protein B7Z80_04580 [Rhodospirillales bacterium 20-64-7]
MAGSASAVKLPFDEAVQYFRQKTNMPSAHWTAVMDEANSRSFAVAGATSDALISDFRAAVEKGIAQGTSLGEFRKDFDSIVKKHGWSHTGEAGWRAKVIYNTNLATSFAAGRYAQQTDPDVLAAFPYWEYVHVNCPNPRLQHVAWSGMVLRADDPFWSYAYPPNGFGCHCIVVSTNDRIMARQGKRLCDSPKVQWQDYVNRKTGVVTKVPTGVDPGFVSNPGKAWAEHKKIPLNSPSLKPVGPTPPVLAPPGATKALPEVLAKFLREPGDDSVQIATLPRVAGPADKNAVVLDADVLKQTADKHGALDAAALEEIAAAISGIDATPNGLEPVTVHGASWVVTLRWNAAQGVWRVVTLDKQAP